MRAGIIVIALAVTACGTNVTPRGDPPRVSYTSSRTADDVAGCMVQALNAKYTYGSHHIQIIQPGKVYEVTQTQELMVGGQPYFARVTAIDTGSRVDMYAVWQFKYVAEAAEACRT